jgi:shikimate kinase
MKETKNIAFCGLMGSGKTTIGFHFAKMKHKTWVDLDKRIEEKMQMTISSIFETKGETFFRELEQFTLKEILQKNNQVISLGGGSPCYAQNLNLLKKETILIWLDPPIHILVNRLQAEQDSRPLLQNQKDLNDFLKKMRQDRIFFYSQSELRIEAFSIEEILEIVLDYLKNITY